jgi:hypothetical protein
MILKKKYQDINMENMEIYNLEELKLETITETNGGSFGYDVGWFLHWSFSGAFSGNNPEATAGAAVAYVKHYNP